MRLIKEYRCDNRLPSDDEIKMGIEIANAEDCIVLLYFNHQLNVLGIVKGMSFEECKERLNSQVKSNWP